MKRTPKIMYVRVSENCNSNCFMCHYRLKHDSYNLSEDKFANLLEIMQKDDYKIIRFTGGETLLHKNIFKFINDAKKIGLKTSIITNGFLLDLCAEKLVANGLDQCIISLDGSSASIHDSLRNFEGCFDNIIKGIKKLKKLNPNIIIRVNTVVSGKNIHDLSNIYKLLVKLQVNEWSIIPIKYKENLWNDDSKRYYEEFQNLVKNSQKIKFLGDSKNFAGTKDEEINAVFNNNSRLKTLNECYVVDYVRFYIPDKNILVPCNCVAHRLNEIPFTITNNLQDSCEEIRNWLKKNSSSCTGCEPLNIYINDHPEIMECDEINY